MQHSFRSSSDEVRCDRNRELKKHGTRDLPPKRSEMVSDAQRLCFGIGGSRNETEGEMNCADAHELCFGHELTAMPS